MTVTMPLSRMLAELKDLPQQARPAVARAINTTVKQAEIDLYGEMRRVFDRPTRWTMGALKVEAASAAKLDAVVRVRGKNDTGSAVPPEAYLRAQIEGGDRRFKRFEVALFKVGAMPAGYVAVPGAGARIDAFGNMSSGQIVQLLSYFKAFPEAGYRGNTSDAKRTRMAKSSKRKRGVEFFSVGRGDKTLRPGIYERISFGPLGSGVRPVLFFRSKATYQRRLKFVEVGQRSVEDQMPRQYLAELGRAFGGGGRL